MPAELTKVILLRAVPHKSRVLPVGSTGVVVHAYRSGWAYEVEFGEPFHAVATVAAGDIRAVKPNA